MRPFRLDDRDALRRAYVDEGLSLSAIAAMLGCSDATVRRALLEEGIEIRRSGRMPITPLRDRVWLRERVAEGQSTKDIARMLGCAEATVRSALQWARAVPPASDVRPPALNDRSFLEQTYVIRGQPARRIAEELGCTKDAVLLALRRHGLPVRARGRRPDAEETTEEPSPDEPRPVGGASLLRLTPAGAEERDRAPGDGGSGEVRRSSEEPSAVKAPDAPARREGRPDPEEAVLAEATEGLLPTSPRTQEEHVSVPRQPTMGTARHATASLRPEAVDLSTDEVEARAFPIVRRGYDRDEVDSFLRRVAQNYREALERAREAEALVQQALAEPPRGEAFEDLGGRVAAILRSASDVAEGIKAEAEEEAAAIRQEAHAAAEHVRREAAEHLAEAERVRAAAEQEAERVLAEARSEGIELVAAARERAAEVKQLSEQRASTLERATRANVEALVAEARRDYEHLLALQQQCIDRLASVEFLAKHAREGLSESSTQSFDAGLERTS